MTIKTHMCSRITVRWALATEQSNAGYEMPFKFQIAHWTLLWVHRSKYTPIRSTVATAQGEKCSNISHRKDISIILDCRRSCRSVTWNRSIHFTWRAPLAESKWTLERDTEWQTKLARNCRQCKWSYRRQHLSARNLFQFSSLSHFSCIHRILVSNAREYDSTSGEWNFECSETSDCFDGAILLPFAITFIVVAAQEFRLVLAHKKRAAAGCQCLAVSVAAAAWQTGNMNFHLFVPCLLRWVHR